MLQTMVKACLCDCSDAYLLVKGTIAVVGKRANEAAITADINNKLVIFENFAPFSGPISKINKTQVHNAKDLDIVMHIV